MTSTTTRRGDVDGLSNPGILQGGTFDSSEIFWGQLAGCLESINNGTTTVVDHSHLNYAEDRGMS